MVLLADDFLQYFTRRRLDRTGYSNTYIIKLFLGFLPMSNQQEEEIKDEQTSREEQELEDEEKYDTLWDDYKKI